MHKLCSLLFKCYVSLHNLFSFTIYHSSHTLFYLCIICLMQAYNIWHYCVSRHHPKQHHMPRMLNMKNFVSLLVRINNIIALRGVSYTIHVYVHIIHHGIAIHGIAIMVFFYVIIIFQSLNIIMLYFLITYEKNIFLFIKN